MAKAKALTYREFIECAKQHYTKGGDTFFECWGESEFDFYVNEFGPISKKDALEMFREELDMQKERAGWY